MKLSSLFAVVVVKSLSLVQKRIESIVDSFLARNISSNDMLNSCRVKIYLFHNHFPWNNEDVSKSVETKTNNHQFDRTGFFSLQNEQEKPTPFSRAFRRKNALHDIQVRTSKFNPRAISPQTEQINGLTFSIPFVSIVQIKSTCYTIEMKTFDIKSSYFPSIVLILTDF